jgi:hypothetical protein
VTAINDSPRPPEWWTAENTEAWAREVWGDLRAAGETMREWGSKLRGGSKAGAACYRPLTTKELIEARANDPRPANPCYYDGTPIEAYKPLTVKRGKKS